MFAKFLSTFLASVLMLMSSIVPGFTVKTDRVLVGDFIAMVDEAFGYLAPETKTDADVLGVSPDSEYYQAVKTADEYGILADFEKIDVKSYSDVNFVSTVLVNASAIELDTATTLRNAKSFSNPDKVATAITSNIIKANAKTVKNSAMSKTEITEAITNAYELSLTITAQTDSVTYVEDVKVLKSYEISDNNIIVPASANLTVGDTCILENAEETIETAAFIVKDIEKANDELVVTKTSAVPVQDVIERINYEGTTDVDLTTATIQTADGQVLANSFETSGLSKEDIAKQLKKLANVSFSVKGFNIKAKVTDTGLDFSVAKQVCDGMVMAKAYSLTNLTVDAKADMSVSKLSFNDVFVLCDYDLKDTTSISGSYAKAFGEEYATVGEKLSAENKVAELINKYALNKLDSTSIKLFTFTVPLGSTPLTITFDITLNIDVNGRITIDVYSHETHGLHIINNKVSIINDSILKDRQVTAYGNFETALGLDVSLGLYGYALVDIGIEGGVGATVDATLRLVDENGNVVVNSTYTVPVDYIVGMCAGLDFDGQIDIGGQADLYGILKISVGEHSVMDKVGLSKTWTIYDASNGQFAHLKF